VVVDGEAGEEGGVNGSFSYQWSRNGVPIAGQTGNTYKAVTADVGTTLGCEVTLAITPSDPVPGPPTPPPPVVAQKPVNEVAPVITGTPMVGDQLTVSEGVWE
jgi:hypothetical protein